MFFFCICKFGKFGPAVTLVGVWGADVTLGVPLHYYYYYLQSTTPNTKYSKALMESALFSLLCCTIIKALKAVPCKAVG